MGNSGLLTTWKEIASYLNRSERTCRTWKEQKGLPVHQVGNNKKSTVYASKDEIDTWVHKRTASKISSRPGIKKAAMIPLALALFSVPLVIIVRGQRTEPANFIIENSKLAIIDETGKELWKRIVGPENLMGDDTYRGHFQIKRIAANAEVDLPYLIIRDINKDGHKEVMFSTQTHDELGEGRLLCLGPSGKLLWQFQAGKRIRRGRLECSEDYRIAGLGSCDITDDEAEEILVLAYSRDDVLCQCAVLDCRGNLLGEFWNCGHLSDFDFFDIDGDSDKEIILTGQNSEYERGCLIALDPLSISGASPQSSEEFAWHNLEPGSELYYVLFPRTQLSVLEWPAEAIQNIVRLSNQTFTVTAVPSGLAYRISSDIGNLEVIPSHVFRHKYKEAQMRGQINVDVDDELNGLVEHGFLYWNGDEWTNRRSRNLKAGRATHIATMLPARYPS